MEFEFKASARQDLALVALETLVCSLLAIRYEWTERFFAWTRRWEFLEVDEIAFVLLALPIGLAWFSVRRWRAAKRELDRRISLEAARRKPHACGASVILLDVDVTLDIRHALSVTGNRNSPINSFLSACAASQPDDTILVRVDPDTAQARNMLSGQLRFDLGCDRRILHEGTGM